MTKIFCITSGKGGVGKTVTAVNLAAALLKLKKDVLLLDASLTTPNVSQHLGTPVVPVTLHDVLKGKAYITEAIYIHPSGLKIIPAGISLEDLKEIDPRRLDEVIMDLMGHFDYIIMDSSAGLGREAIAAIKNSDEVIVVTNPEIPALTEALKVIKIAEELGTNVRGVIVNRVTNAKYEPSVKHIEAMLEKPVIGVVPEDPNVKKSIALRNPIVFSFPDSPAAKAFIKIAAELVGEKIEIKEERKEGFLDRILKIFKKR